MFKDDVVTRLLHYVIPPDDLGTDCWIWGAGTAGGGYGIMSVNGKQFYAHRISYSIFRKGAPKDLELDHLCGQTACVNPVHLEPVTHQENVNRGRCAEVARANRLRDQTYTLLARNLFSGLTLGQV